MSKFDQLTTEMEEWINKYGREKLTQGREMDWTWEELEDNFNTKWEGEDLTPTSFQSLRLWTKKLNPNWREGKERTWVTPERIEHRS